MARTYKRGKVWYSDLFINGKRVQKALSTNKQVAEEKLGELIKQRGAAKHGHAVTSSTYAAAKERFLKVYSHKSPITYRHYLRTFKRIEEWFPLRELRQITPDTITALLSDWKGEGRGLYVRNRDVENVVSFMRRAESWRMVAPQDWDTIMGKEPEPRGRVHFFNKAEMSKLTAKTYGLWRTVTMLGAMAGLRPGEMFWLEWSDVDFDYKKIHIDSKPDYGWHVKTYERRTIPIPADLHKYLLSLERGAWVLGDRPKSINSMSTYYSRRVRASHLKGSMYTLRHTYGSHLAQAGVPLQVIRDLMGHRSVVTTEIYAHLIPEMHQAAVEHLNRAETATNM